jgi:hypothetical protein
VGRSRESNWITGGEWGRVWDEQHLGKKRRSACPTLSALLALGGPDGKPWMAGGGSGRFRGGELIPERVLQLAGSGMCTCTASAMEEIERPVCAGRVSYFVNWVNKLGRIEGQR